MIFADLQLSKRIERAEALFNANFVEARSKLFPETKAQWIEVAGTYAMFDGVQSPCSQTFRFGLYSEPTAADLDKIESFFKERHTPVFHEVSPFTHSSALDLLYERRYKPVEFTSVMFRGLKELLKNFSKPRNTYPKS